MGLQRGEGLHLRISSEGDGGDRPEPFEVEGDVERHRCRSGPGTSNSKPAVMATPAAGAVVKVMTPVVVETDQPEASAACPARRDGPGDGLGDGPRPGLRAGGVAFGQLEQGGRPVAGADLLVGRDRLRRQAGFEVGPILEAEAVQAAVAGLEEGDDRRQIVGAADAIGDIIAAAAVGPAGVAFLGARGQFDDLGAPFRAAARPAADVVRKRTS
jgi:hypothetical protein